MPDDDQELDATAGGRASATSVAPDDAISAEPTGDDPVFIVGASRSGTTLLSACLSTSRELCIGQETHYFDDLRPRMAGRERAPLSEEDAARCERYFMAFVHGVYGTPIARTWTEEDDRPDARVERSSLRALAAELGPGSDAYFEAFCRLQTAARGKTRWGEKTPRHVFRIAEIFARYPGARIICMVRDPRAVVASYRRFAQRAHRDGHRTDPKYQAWAEQDRARIRRSYHPLVGSILWKASARAAVDARRRFGDERIRLIRYEDLVTSPEKTLRGLSDWLSITFDGRMITNVPRMNSSYEKMKVDGGIGTESVERWRGDLGATEVALIQHCSRSTMAEFGYDVDTLATSRLRIAWAWLRLPFEVIPILWVNRTRIAGSFGYVTKRLLLALRRRA